jgi:hypothetical protein
VVGGGGYFPGVQLGSGERTLNEDFGVGQTEELKELAALLGVLDHAQHARQRLARYDDRFLLWPFRVHVITT